MVEAVYLDKLFEGAKAWNDWRRENPDVVPDLEGIELPLGRRQFGPAHGGPIDLGDCRLRAAALPNAMLAGANLGHAVLAYADLSYANLSGANCAGCDFTGADFKNADLQDANLEGASLHDAQLAHARNLAQGQIDLAHGNAGATLPPSLRRPDHWEVRDCGLTLDMEPVQPLSLMGGDPYFLLGVPRDAPMTVIRAAYIRLAKETHPDRRPGDARAAARFRDVSQAYHRISIDRRLEARRPRFALAHPAVAALVAFLLPIAGFSIYWFVLSPSGGATVSAAQGEGARKRIEFPSPRPADDLPTASIKPSQDRLAAALAPRVEQKPALEIKPATEQPLSAPAPEPEDQAADGDGRAAEEEDSPVLAALPEARSAPEETSPPEKAAGREPVEAPPPQAPAAPRERPPEAVAAPASPKVADRIAWQRARRRDIPAAYRDYLAAHPDGFFSAQARRRLDLLTSPAATTANKPASDPPKRVAAEERPPAPAAKAAAKRPRFPSPDDPFEE